MSVSAVKNRVEDILKQEAFSKEDILTLLGADKAETKLLLKQASETKLRHVGNVVYYRGLIEFSNYCRKDCLYCGIRKSNKAIKRYHLSDTEILDAAKFADSNNYGSLILQSGETANKSQIDRITSLLKEIKKITKKDLGITLSCGEQTEETYQTWFDSGAHRYLLRIETSNELLYRKLHPENGIHDYRKRLQAIKNLQKIGYQTGTGVMVGLPFQTLEDLADDLLFMQELDIDMCGMGPYITHKGTPLHRFENRLLPDNERLTLTLKMIAILRLMMKDINIAATTAMQAIDPMGREKAIQVGGNVMMPNITPGTYRSDYSLYENKPCTDDEAADCKSCLEVRIQMVDNEIGYGKWGDSKHFFKKV